jgi:hypothetical protein
MPKNIQIKEDSIDVAIKVNGTITEFDNHYDKSYFEDRYKDSAKLILVAYVDNQPAGYMLSYLVKSGFNFVEVHPQVSVKDNRILLEKEILKNSNF